MQFKHKKAFLGLSVASVLSLAIFFSTNMPNKVTASLGDLLDDPLDPVENILEDPLDPVEDLLEEVEEDVDNLLADPVDAVEDILEDPVETLEGLLDNDSPILEDLAGGFENIVEDLHLSSYELPRVGLNVDVPLGYENGANVDIEIFNSRIQPFAVSVDYVVESGTAKVGEDFVPLMGTAVIGAGERSTSISLNLIDDYIPEDVEHLRVRLFRPINAVLGNDLLEFEIRDNDQAGITLDPACAYVEEGGEGAVYYLSLNTRPTEVVDITLTPNKNGIELAPSTLSITPNNWKNLHPININGYQGGVINTSEVLLVSDSLDARFLGEAVISLNDILVTDEFNSRQDGLVNINNCEDADRSILGGLLDLDDLNEFDLPLELDDLIDEDGLIDLEGLLDLSGLVNPDAGDELAIVDLEYHAFCGEESADIGASATVKLNEAKPFDVAVGYLVTGGTLTLGDDFIPESGVVIIKAGETSVEIPFTGLIDDKLEEAAESVVVQLFSPVNAILGETQRLECNIQDNLHAGINIAPFCINVEQGQSDPSYYVSLTTRPNDSVGIDIIPSNQLEVDPFTLTFNPENWNVPQLVSVSDITNALELGILGGDGSGGLLHTSDLLHSFNSLDVRFGGESFLLPLEAFYDDSNFESDSGLVSLSGCSHGTCTPGDSECDPACDPTVQSCGTGGGGGENGDGGSAGFLESTGGSGIFTSLARSYCLNFNADRPLEFVDISDAGSEYEAYVEALKRTQEAASGDYVISGYNSQGTVETDDLRLPFEGVTQNYIGPNNVTLRLELIKMLLISHCYPILDATTLTETYDGRSMGEWVDLPKIHTGDPNADFAVDVAYSGKYWGLWEGDAVGNTIRVSDPISHSEAVKLLLRIQEQVRSGAPITFDSAEGPWWTNFYNKADAEGLAMEARAQDPVSPIIRKVAIKELMLGVLGRNLFKEEAQLAVESFLNHF